MSSSAPRSVWIAGVTLAAMAGAAALAAGHEPAAPTAPATQQTNAAPSADQALAMLKEGNARFFSGKCESPNTDAARRQDTAANGQAPFAVILTCADSRIPVERVFDRGVGDLFVIRVAGNVSDTDEIGTIEYGVGHLHAPLVVVMGHTSCGAVKAVATGAEVHGAVAKLVDNIIPAVEWVKKSRPNLEGDELVAAAVEANVWQSIDDLISHSPDLAGAVEKGGVKVVGAVYDIASGKARFLGEHPFQSKLISRAKMSEQAPVASAQPTPGAPVTIDQTDPHAEHASPEAHAQAGEDEEDDSHDDTPHDER